MKVIKKIRPMFTSLVTTCNLVDDIYIGNTKILDAKSLSKPIDEYQKVICVGSLVRDIKVGDLVKINPSRFSVKKHKPGTLNDGVIQDNPIIEYKFDVVELDGTKYLLLQDRDIEYIVDEYDEIDQQENKESILVEDPRKKLIY